MHILSFDIEEWFHIHDTDWVSEGKWPMLDNRVIKNTELILGFLSTHNIKATFYVLGWIAEQYPELIRQISQKGHEIGFHSRRHLRPFRQSRHEFEQDLVLGIQHLKGLTGKDVATYRAPDLTLNTDSAWIVDLLSAHGIQSGSSTRQGVKLCGNKVPGQPIILQSHSGRKLIEFPVNRFELPFKKIGYTGSGFFRVIPMPLLKYFFNSNPGYTMCYFHPRDFDTSLPWDKGLTPVRNWKNTAGSRSTMPKMEYFARKYDFIHVGAALSQLDQSKLTVFQLSI